MISDYPPIIMNWYFDRVIPSETCQRLINMGDGNWEQAGSAVSRTEVDENYRISDVAWINDQWVYDLIWTYMMKANEESGWKYNIVSAENCQVTRYTEGGHFSWHRDALGSHNEVYDEPKLKFLHGNARKLSMSIFLNSDFEGGDFEMHAVDDGEKILAKEGSVIVFPSFMVHRVTPVTKGIRYSLVAWFLGPPFV